MQRMWKMTHVAWVFTYDKDLEAANKRSKWKSNKLIFEMLMKGINIGVWNFSMYLQVCDVRIGVECEIISIETLGSRMNKKNWMTFQCFALVISK